MNDENIDLMLSDKHVYAQTVDDAAAVKNKRRELLHADAQKKRKEIEEKKLQIAALQKEIEENEKALKKSRNSVRTHFMIVIAADVIAIFGLGKKEADCVTKEDYKHLQKTVTRKAKKLAGQQLESEEFGYDDLVFALGLSDDAKRCKNPDDYKNLNMAIIEKVKKMIVGNGAERKKVD